MIRVLASGALLVLAACDGGGDPVEQALRETAAANHAATVREGAVYAPVVAEAPSPDAALRDSLLASHRQDLARAEATATAAADPELKRLAAAAVQNRRREIAALEATSRAE